MPATVQVTFAAPFPEPHLTIVCWPPFAELNQIFAACFAAHVQPYALAIDAGKISEETSTALLAKAYSEGVITRALEPTYAAWKPADWERFLILHPAHFEELRAHLEVRRNWDEVVGHGGHQRAES